MSENKINPLLEAMSEIDDSMITNKTAVVSTKKSKKRAIIIAAAAAAMMSVAIPVTSGAFMRTHSVMNNEVIEPEYDVYVDERGHTVETFVYNVPEYALKGGDPRADTVGKLRVMFDYDSAVDALGPGAAPTYRFKVVDEEGKVVSAANNKIIIAYKDGNYMSSYGSCCPNLAEGYEEYHCHYKHTHDGVEVDDCFYIVPEEEIYDIYRLHGGDADRLRAEREENKAWQEQALASRNE